MNEPITLISLGALIPLILAAAAWGSASAKLSRALTEIDKVLARVEIIATQQARHSVKIEELEGKRLERERELLDLLKIAYGVNNKGSRGNNQQ